MKKFYFILAAGAMLFAACAKEQFAPAAGTTVLNLSIEESKTVLGELSESNTRPIYWENGDQVCCNGIVSKPLSSVAEKAKSAKFEFDGVLSEPYNLLYPASFYETESTVTLPAIAKEIPLAGQGASMKAVTGIIKLSLKLGEDKDKIASVTVTSPSQQLSGVFGIDYETGVISGQSSSAADKKLTMNVAKYLPEEGALELFIPVPAGDYEFTVRIVDVCGHFMEKSTTAAKTIVAGQVSAFPELTFVPTGTQFDVVITSAADLVKFAQDWNAGSYDYNPVVILENDIEFDDQTNADFLAAGGIGQEEDPQGNSNYFNGCFEGNGKSIRNWKNNNATKETALTEWTPLFAFTGAAGIIQNLTIDSSCDIKVGKGTFGTIVGRHKGILRNVTIEPKVIYQEAAGTAYVGGLVGRVYGGSVENCVNQGGLQMPAEGSEGTTKVLRVGGIAGSVEAGGTLKDCYLKNSMYFGTKSAGSGPQNPNAEVLAGGIVGNIMDGTVEYCHSDALVDLRGKSGLLYAGKIAGKVDKDGTVSNCTCIADSAMYVRMTANAVFNNDNYTKEPSVAAVGGIAGYNEGKIIASSFNGKDVTSNHGAAYQYCGGVAGYNCGTITDSNNSGAVIGPSQYVTVQYYYAGGIAGWTTTELTNLSNSGTISWTPSASANTVYQTSYLGGCVGCTEASLTGLVNDGAVTIGKSSYTVPQGMNNINIAGVVALVASAVNVADCDNNGSIQITAPGTLSATAPNTHVAGIAANVAAGATVSGCDNKGLLYNGISQNGKTETQSQKTGGIIAYADGTQESNVTVTGCKNIDTSGKKYYGARGYLGGIVAWAGNTVITNCESTMSQAGFLGWFSAGIAAKMVASRVEGCTARCGIAGRYINNGSAGGITATMDATSKIIDSEYFGDIAVGDNQTKNAEILGGIAGCSEAGAEISACRFGGTIKKSKSDTATPMTQASICSDTNFTVNQPNTLITK